MSDGDGMPPNSDTWEDSFRGLILSLGTRADQRARSSSESSIIISNLEAQRHLLQYGNDLIHRLYQSQLSVDARETCLESLCFLVSGAFRCGGLEEKGKQGGALEPIEITETIKRERKTGPVPLLRRKIQADMLEALRNGKDLRDEKQDVLVKEYGNGASRGTVVVALQKALSEFEAENNDKTLPVSDKL